MSARTKQTNTTSLEEALRARLGSGGKVFLPYLTAGLPSPQRFVDLITQIARFADAVEIGIPFTDPVMDGPVIQEASTRALDGGMRMSACISLIKEVKRHSDVPLVVMTYYNPIHKMGSATFARSMDASGVAGVIVPDLPWEESDELASQLAPRGIALVQMVAPTTSEERARKLAQASSGFVYAAARLGVTGERDLLEESSGRFVEMIKKNTSLPVLLGIGISNGSQAREGARHADGVIVGSALVKKVLGSDIPGALALGAEIRKALDELE